LALNLLLSHERSGSHFVGEFLASHPNVRMFDEVCNPLAVPANERPESMYGHLHAYLQSHPELLLDMNFGRKYAWAKDYFEHLQAIAGTEHVVVDIKYGHMHAFEQHWWQSAERPLLLHLCQWEGIGVVHLYRENIVEACISMQVAEQSKVWHSWQPEHETGSSQRKAEKVHIDTAKLLAMCHSFRLERQLVERWLPGTRHHTLTYEEAQGGLTGRKPGIALAQFVGARGYQSTAALYGRVSRSLPQMIENYDDVVIVCECAGLGRYLPSP
jgi:hypothetical protein